MKTSLAQRDKETVKEEIARELPSRSTTVQCAIVQRKMNVTVSRSHIRRQCSIFCRGWFSKGEEGLRFYLAGQQQRYARISFPTQGEPLTRLMSSRNVRQKRHRWISRSRYAAGNKTKTPKHRTMAELCGHESCIIHFLGIGCRIKRQRQWTDLDASLGYFMEIHL